MPETLRYPGDQTNFDPEHVLGPDADRRYLRVRAMTYDPSTNVSTGVLRAVMPVDFTEQVVLRAMKQVRDVKRLRELFRAE